MTGTGGIRSELVVLRKKSIEINFSFSKMDSLIRRTRLIALNADVAASQIGQAGAGFSVVVSEVNTMARELSVIVLETEALFKKLSMAVSEWMKIERRISLYQKALALANKDAVNSLNRQLKEPGEHQATVSECKLLESVLLNAEWGDSIMPATFAKWQEGKKACEKLSHDSAETAGNKLSGVIWQNMLDLSAKIRVILSEAGEVASRLPRLMERLGMVATRKSQFIAVAALIESARIGEGGKDLATVAETIRQLANDIAGVEKAALSNVNDLGAQVNLVHSAVFSSKN